MLQVSFKVIRFVVRGQRLIIKVSRCFKKEECSWLRENLCNLHSPSLFEIEKPSLIREMKSY